MDEATFDLLLARAQNQWVRYECYRLVCETATRRCRKRAQWLAWATIGLAVVATAVSGFDAATAERASPLAIIATGLAAATTFVATVRQTFNWEAKAQKNFAAAIEVGNIQRSLQDYVEMIARRTKAEDQTFLSICETRFQKLLDPEADDPAEFAGKAQAAWGESYVSRLKLRAGQLAPMPPAPADAPEPEQLESAELQPFVRRG